MEIQISSARKPRVALYMGRGCRGAGCLDWARLLSATPEFDFAMIGAADVRAGGLAHFDCLVMPGGGGFERYEDWGEDGCAKIREFIYEGGAYFGTCAGFSVLLNEDKRVRLLPFKQDGNPLRGGMMASVQLLPCAEERLGVKVGTRSIVYHNGPCPVPTEPIPGVNVEVLATYVCNLMEFGEEESSMYGKPALVWATYGKGRLYVFGCHPERSPVNRDLLVAGFHALLGVRPSFPQKPVCAGRLRVAVFAMEFDETPDPIATASDIAALCARADVDVVFATVGSIRGGLLDHMDALLLPGGLQTKLATSQAVLDDFLQRGGRIVTTAAEV